MFEDFSFSSPSSSRPPRLALDGDDKLVTDCDNSMISPMSSRCPSPRSFAAPRFPRSRSLCFRSPQPAPTSVPFSAYDHKRLSIGTLTKKLHEHTIQNPEYTSRPASPTTTTGPRSSFSSHFPGYVLTPPDTDHDDEGYGSPISASPSPQRRSPFLIPTSVPIEFQSDIPSQPDLSAPTDSYTIRSRRQQMSRLQGQYTSTDLDAIRRALLAAGGDEMHKFNPLLTEACHPSSLPPQQARRRRTINLQRPRVRSRVSPDTAISVSDLPLRRQSTSGSRTLAAHSNRIEKSYQTDSRRGEQELRQKSMVSAALASMIENRE